MQRQNQSQNANPPEDFSLKETAPHLGGGRFYGDRQSTSYDLVEQMQYLYVRVVKAKELPAKDDKGTACNPLAEVKLGNYKGSTKHLEKNSNPEWNQVFAFPKDRIQASVIEIVVRDKDSPPHGYMGMVHFDLSEVPKRVPPDSPLAPQWYRLEDPKENKAKGGELMLAVWMGTQADEVFPDSWHLDAASIGVDVLASIRSKVYMSPKLWYLRVNVIEAQELKPSNNGRNSLETYVKAVLGKFVLRTRISQSPSINPMWNEDLMFVVAEPFEEQLVLSVEDRVAPNKEEVLGNCVIPLQNVERRLDNRGLNTRWYSLEKHVAGEGEKKKEVSCASKIHLRVCLEGGYHVLDELTHYSSDLRATAKHLWKPSIGVLELGILNASSLSTMKTKDGRGTTDAYCVAKYGQKWVRTRTIIDSTAPKWNEQYTWEVFDPCTVITVGVFDNSHLQGGGKAGGAKDSRIGKVRIRLSTLATNRLYTHSYPLIVLQPSGVKKMGEIQLAVRFSCSSLLNMLQAYSQPLLPKMHYLHPLSVYQLDSLRHQATQMVSGRLSRAEPSLRKEAVEYMLDVGSNMWSKRRSKANVGRIVLVLNGLEKAGLWFHHICSWRNPMTTILTHILFLILALFPGMILPTIFLYLFLIGIWKYRLRPRHPPHMDTRLSHADFVFPDDLDEEFDGFPSSRNADVVRLRYDRLRSMAGRIQTVVGDLATQGERVQSLLSWRDPRATALFVTFCLVASIVMYVIPFRVIVILGGFYVLRHPKFRSRLPSAPFNFFRRLPARSDSMF
ncbi:FT-interacting protein 3-like [Malania oleifera]|uniref:FT-interacting protein 3-like n=1 Tax=Malania oleifera TaxID=397392 RepID=UPI0025AE4947|nr:FT-interacting protein 3-like [Malania oleifera]